MRGSLTKIDLYAHRKRLWGKYFADNAKRKAERNAQQKPFDRTGKVLWLSVFGKLAEIGGRMRYKKAQGTYNFSKHGPFK